MVEASIINAHQALTYIILTLLPFFPAWFSTSVKMKSIGTVIYITKLQAKNNEMVGHVGTQQITKFANDSGSMLNIIFEYGQISMATLQTGCEDFLKAGGARCNQ